MRRVGFSDDLDIPELIQEAEEEEETRTDVNENAIDVDSEDEDKENKAKRQRVATFIQNLPDLQSCVAQTIALNAYGSGETWDSPLTRRQPKPRGSPTEMINKGEKSTRSTALSATWSAC